MKAATFWKTVVMDGSDFLQRLLGLLDEKQIRYCVVGAQAVNAYVEPVVSLDLEIVVAAEQLSGLESSLSDYCARDSPTACRATADGNDSEKLASGVLLGWR